MISMSILSVCLANIYLTSAYESFEKGLTWQWQLTGNIDTSYDVDVYDIDLFDVSTRTISKLKGQGKKVVCYFSGGSSEEWRDDYSSFQANSEVMGNNLHGWDGEKWLDITNWDVLGPIMEARIQLAANKGCDGVEPDNMDGYYNDNGFGLSYDDQLTYNKRIAALAHQYDLAVALKNDLDQIEDLVDYFDFAVNEECNGWNECDRLQAFLDNNKAVFGVEYELKVQKYCNSMNNMDMDFLAKNWDLDSCVYACRDYPSASTPDCLTDIPSSYSGTGSYTEESDDGQGNNTTIIIAIVLVVLLVVTIAVIAIYCKVKKNKSVNDRKEMEVEVNDVNMKTQDVPVTTTES